MASRFEVTNDAGTNVTILLDGQVATAGAPEAHVVVGRKNNAGKIVVKDFHGRNVFRLESPLGAHLFIGATEGLAGFLHILDGTGQETITLEGTSGDIKLSGADCAEMFDVIAAAEPGTVLVIADEHVLRPCDQPYDRRVAGVVSGAGGRRPGVILNGHCAEGVPVALMGRVFCKVDADGSPIEVGDLLTTSSTTGHAMKATDIARTAGTVIGKAMQCLSSGRGMIPVLVALR
jgi:hypothetical protein